MERVRPSNPLNPSFLLAQISNIRAIGRKASSINEASISTLGYSYSNALYNFSKLFSFIYSHSLQLQPTLPSLTSGSTG